MSSWPVVEKWTETKSSVPVNSLSTLTLARTTSPYSNIQDNHYDHFQAVA